MPRSSFRPFSLTNAFSVDNMNDSVPIVYTNNIPLTQTIPTSSTTTSTPATTATIIEVVGLDEEQEQHKRCGCKRCSMNNVYVSNEDLDKKLNWILTIVIFMFIILIIHIRSQNNK